MIKFNGKDIVPRFNGKDVSRVMFNGKQIYPAQVEEGDIKLDQGKIIITNNSGQNINIVSMKIGNNTLLENINIDDGMMYDSGRGEGLSFNLNEPCELKWGFTGDGNVTWDIYGSYNTDGIYWYRTGRLYNAVNPLSIVSIPYNFVADQGTAEQTNGLEIVIS